MQEVEVSISTASSVTVPRPAQHCATGVQEVEAVDIKAAVCLAQALKHYPLDMDLPAVDDMWQLRFLHFQEGLKPTLLGTEIAKAAVYGRAKSAKSTKERRFVLPTSVGGLKRVIEGMEIKGLDSQLVELARLRPCDRLCCVNTSFCEHDSFRSKIIMPRVSRCVEKGCKGEKLEVTPPRVMISRRNRNAHLIQRWVTCVSCSS